MKNSGVSENAIEYQRLTAEIAKTESQVKSLTSQTKELIKQTKLFGNVNLDKMKKDSHPLVKSL